MCMATHLPTNSNAYQWVGLTKEGYELLMLIFVIKIIRSECKWDDPENDRPQMT